MQERVDKMEQQMLVAVNKVNDVLQKLDRFDRKASAQSINRGMREIASAKGKKGHRVRLHNVMF